MPWSAPFEDPSVLPNGRQLITLEDVGSYITKLAKAEHDGPEWQAAMEVLILVAENGGPTMLARIGVMRALNRDAPKAAPPRLTGIVFADGGAGPITAAVMNEKVSSALQRHHKSVM